MFARAFSCTLSIHLITCAPESAMAIGTWGHSSAVVLQEIFLASRRLEDLKKGLGLGLDKIVLVLVLKKGLADSTGP
jgi:hypothetical protein